jgi:hypothetical protein
MGEGVEGERLFPVVDEIDRVLDIVHHDDGKNQSEYLFRHHGRAGRHVGEHGRCDVEVVPVVLAADDRTARVEQPHQPVEVVAVDDPGERGVGGRVVAEPHADGVARGRLQGAGVLAVGDDVVGARRWGGSAGT